MNDFGPSWRDGHAFNAIIHNVRPDLVDMEAVPQRKNRENLEHAFSTAEQHLGIPRLLDPEGKSEIEPGALILYGRAASRDSTVTRS